MNAAFNQIRQVAQPNVAVTIRLLETIALVVAHASSEEVRAAATQHAVMIQRGIRGETLDEWDRNDIEERYQAVMRACGCQDALRPTPPGDESSP